MKIEKILTTREEFVIKKRICDDMSYGDIGKILGVTKQRICHICKLALQKLSGEFMKCEMECPPKPGRDPFKCNRKAKWIIPANEMKQASPKFACTIHKNVYERSMGPSDKKCIPIKDKMKGPICPYCRARSILVNSTIIYGKDYGMIYLCSNYPECDSFVGVHEGTDKPKGTLANTELRNLRKECHQKFDKLWQDGDHCLDRKEAYEWLSKMMNMKEAHIGEFGLEDCHKLLKIFE